MENKVLYNGRELSLWDVAIVGAGTAGLTAAIYTQRAGKRALVIEALTPGGQIVNTPEIENYPGLFGVSGYEYATKLYEQAQTLGAEFEFDSVLRIEEADGHKVVKTAMGEYAAKAVILATGAKNRPLGLEKEQELIGHGVSYCATCDGMFYKGKIAAVNGGGNTAVEDAMFLANYCEKVYLIHRRDAFRADQSAVEKLKRHPNVEFVLNATVTKLLAEKPEAAGAGASGGSPFAAAGAPGGASPFAVAGFGGALAAEKLVGIEVTDKFTGEVRTIQVDGLFIAIGQQPANEAFADVAALDPAGYLVAGEDCKTRTQGVFVAGDCRTKEVRQLTTAASDGAVAALAACKYIDNSYPLEAIH